MLCETPFGNVSVYSVIINIQKIIDESKNSTNDNISVALINSFIIPVPPIAEQERIVKEIERFEPLLAEYDKLEFQATKLDTEIYDKLKKSILQYAIQGKLVEQDENDEPASVLLERIRTQKKTQLGKKYIESYIYKGDDNCYYEKVGSTVRNITDEISFDIPNNWSWARLSEIVVLSSGKPYVETLSGFLYVKVADMNLVENQHCIKTSLHHCQAQPSDAVPINSVIFPKRGGAIATNKKKKVLTDNVCIDLNTMAMTPIENKFFDYLFIWFSTIDLGKMSTGSSVPQINNIDIYPLLIPIPPLDEQKRIVNAVNNIFSKIKDES